VPRHVHELPACRRRASGDGVDGLLVADLVPEPVGRDDQKLAPGIKGHPGDRRVGDDPPLQRAVAERAGHGKAALHPPHATAAAAHVAALPLDALPLLLPGAGVVRRQRGRCAVAAQHGAAVADVRDVEVPAPHQRRCGACAAAFTLRRHFHILDLWYGIFSATNANKQTFGHDIYGLSFNQIWRLENDKVI